MADPTQNVIIELILRYIGGSKLSPTSKLDVGGQKVAVQSTSLQAIADQLSKYGTTAEQIRNAVLTNPKANVVSTTKSNIDQMKTLVGNL